MATGSKSKSKAKARGGKRAKATKGAKPAAPAKRRPKVKRTPARKRVPVAAGVAPVDGPVTLEEAQALARARAPRHALRRRAQVLAGPTPAKVGEAEQDLRKATREERERRKREYRETMLIMKRRGARRRAPTGRRRGPGPEAAFQPLQIFAEGDSWFDYPVPLFGGGVIPRLQKRLGVPILNMASAGDEVRFMLGVEQRRRLIECLTQGCPAGGPWDVMLFSGGGNDIVDNPMALWIRDFTAGQSPEQLVHEQRFATALAMVRAGYEDLITLRDALSPTTHLVFHAYDFAIPDGRGICNKGPWMKPAFDLRGFPDRASAFAVVKVMLGRFAAMLDDLAQAPGVSVVRTQGTLAEQPSAWHNELHPQKAGFETFAGLFHAALKAQFPARVA